MATAKQAIPAKAQGGAVQAAEPPVLERSIPEQVVRERFEALLRQVQANRPSEDVSLIRKAWEFCVQHHEGQMRASGEPYIIHPLEVAEVLAEMKLDATAIAAGLLHDAVEDTPGHQRGDRKPNSATRWPTSSRASPRSTRSSSPTAKTARPRTCARCCWPWSPMCAWCSSSWPTACTTCAPWST